MRFFYQIFITLYPLIARIISPFSPKAKKWVDGRKHLLEKIGSQLSQDNAPKIWMHCASLGEFEQARPLIEQLKKDYSNYHIIVTFFSPSGYEIRKNYALADAIFYLPMDSKSHAQQFLDIVRPQIAIFIKYEFWYHYLKTLHQRQIPTFLIAGIFRPDQLFFKPYGKFYRNILQYFTCIHLQNETSQQLLQSIGINDTIISGDTRFDRVLEIAKQWKPIPEIANFIEQSPSLVAGSIWPEDDKALLPSIINHPEIKFILAPHEIHADRIAECLHLFPNSIAFSTWKEKTTIEQDKFQCLIIDNMGMLSKMYYYGEVTYVGGAWGHAGIHNTLEAAVFYKPVLFGPYHHKSIEVQNLIDAQGGFSAQDIKALTAEINRLYSDTNYYQEKAQNAGNFVKTHAGATPAIMKSLANYLKK